MPLPSVKVAAAKDFMVVALGSNTAVAYNVSGKQISVLEGHSENITDVVCLTQDMIATASRRERTVRLWNAKTGECLDSWSKTVSIAAVLDGNRIITTDIPTIVQSLETDKFGSVAVFSDGNYAVTASSDCKAKLWNLQTGECLQTLSKAATCNRCIAYLAPQDMMLSMGACKLELRDVHTGCCQHTFQGRDGEPHVLFDEVPDQDATTSLAVYLKGLGYVATVAFNNFSSTLKVWDLERRQCVQTVDVRDLVVCIACLSESNLIITGLGSGTANVWNTQTGECVNTLSGHRRWVLSAVLVSAFQAVTGSVDGDAKLWDLRVGECLQTFRHAAEGLKRCIAAVGVITGTDYVFTGSFFVSYFGDASTRFPGDRSIKIWSCTTGDCLHSLTLDPAPMPGPSSMLITETRGHSLLVVGFTDGAIKTFLMPTQNAESIQYLGIFRLHRAPVKYLVAVDGYVISHSSKDVVINSDALMGGILQSAELPGFGIMNRLMPKIFYAFEAVNVLINVVQLVSFACDRDTPKPKQVEPPARFLNNFQQFGLNLVISPRTCFWMGALLVALFIMVMLTQESVKRHAWLSQSTIWSIIFFTMASYTKFCAQPALLLILKSFGFYTVTAMAEPTPSGLLVAILVTFCLLLVFVYFTFRLARADYALKDLEMRRNIFDRSGDRVRTPQMRQRIHALSSQDPHCDIIITILKVVLLASSFMINISKRRGVTLAVAFLRLLCGFALFLAGIHYDRYFPPYPGSCDMNRARTSLDTGVLATYIISLVAILAQQDVDSWWFKGLAVSCLPAVFAGYFVRPRCKILESNMKSWFIARGSKHGGEPQEPFEPLPC